MADNDKRMILNIGHVDQLNTGDHATFNHYANPKAKEEKVEAEVEEAQATDLTPDYYMSDGEQKLSAFIQDPGRRAGVIRMLKRVTTARELAFEVVAHLHDEPLLNQKVIVSRPFIEAMLQFAPGIQQGRSVDNVRDQINKMWTEQRKNWK